MKRSKKSSTLFRKKNEIKTVPAFVRTFIKRVQNFANARNLWQKNERFIIAVSGGPDSLCLLDLMVRLSKKYHWPLHVAHVNYRLRGRDSLLDERLVKERAAFYKIPITVFHPRVKKRGNLEESLRDTRYLLFEKLRKKEKADTLVVAHNRDDQAETLLMRLLRGSGLRGLSAMRPKNNFTIRPLLATSREDIYEYARAAKLPFREDRSNRDPRFLRNRIRHTLLPSLEKNFNPRIKESLAETAELLASDYETLEAVDGPLSITRKKHSSEFSRDQALSLPTALLRRELRHLLRPYFGGKNPSYASIEEILKLLKSSKSKVQELAFQGLILRRNGDRVRLLKIPPSLKKA